MKFISLMALFAALSFSQVFQGSLRGRIVDPAGAIAAGVQVTLIDEATALTRSTISNDQGEYVFNSVQPATYTVTAEATGFKRLDRKGVSVATQAAVTIDLALQIGEVSEQVTVVDAAPQLQTGDASVGQVLDSRKITDLPLLGRNPFFVAKLSQSVVFVANPKMGRMQDQNANSAVSIAGGPLRSNNTLLDGVSITDANNRAVILPSPEAVQELKLQTATYDAEAGRTGGGTFNTVLRSGTNQLHGSAVGYIRQDGWTANSFFANRAGNPVPSQPFKQFAGSLGGPIVIPKLYDGRNRTFFFASTEAYRQLDASTVNQSVPTALERNGNFSQTLNNLPVPTQQTIYDPLTTTTAGVRTAFVGNIIPASRLDPIGVKLASYYPGANLPTPYYGSQNYSFTGNFPNRGDQQIYKLDQQFTPWLRASGSYIYQKTGETGAPLSWANAATPGQNLLFRRINSTQANATITPSPTVVISVRWGFNRFFSTSGPTLSSGFNLASLGLPQSLADQTVNPAFPAITMGTLTSFGGGTRSRDTYYSRTAGATISKLWGRHSLKGGFDFRTLHDAATPAVGPTGLGFTDVFTRPNPASATTGQGSDLATLLLGYPTSGSQSVVSNLDNYLRYYGFFVQDDFRFNSKLTFNVGLRLEYESGIREVNNRLITGFDATAQNPLDVSPKFKGVVQYAGVNGNPTQTGDPIPVKLGPRFGFAYSPNNKTVIRGGYGISWAPTYFNYQNTIGYSQTTSLVASAAGNNFIPATTLANPYPDGLIQPTGNAAGGLSGVGQAITIPDVKTRHAGYVQQFSLEVQREVPAGFVVTVGALGSHSLRLLSQGVNINQLNPSFLGYGSLLVTPAVANPLSGKVVGTLNTPTIGRNQLWRPFPQFASVALSNQGAADARYQSGYIKAERRYSKGLSLLASYTWSRSMDNVLGQALPGTSSVTSAAGAQNAYNLNAEFGLSTQDVPNRFTTAVTYELPVGRGKALLKRGGVLDWIVGGWSANLVSIYQSGYPLAITQTNNNANIGATGQRPNATGISPQTSGSIAQRIDGWLNPNAFTLASAFTFGNVSRFINVRGPRLSNFDASLFKTFTFKERIRAQFRAEALNLTNTPYFGQPNTNRTDNQFGKVTTQINYARLFHLGVRVTF
ncbi:MAG: carboxypeptidase-like regulatory domain-containing protein [Acidobacteriota bacterium]